MSPRRRLGDTGGQEASISLTAPTPLIHDRERFRIEPIDASMDRLTKITVCTRPFRAQGPRIEAEQVGNKLLVHNYGHGGSGWSLSWGSAALVVPMALGGGATDIAVVGCGALGITSALMLQREGARVTIYARDLPEATRSARATGTWTPDARVALKSGVDAGFAARWEAMARTSFAAYQDLLQAPGRLLEFHDRYTLTDVPPAEAIARREQEDAIGFLKLESRIADVTPPGEDLGPGEHPFPTAFCRRASVLRFNIAPYQASLMQEFRERGGTVRQAEFHTPQHLLALPESVIVHCTGYGARALFGDETLIPVRGQISWLPPEPQLPYSLVWRDLNVVPRADGTVIQLGAQGDALGWQDATEVPNSAETERAMGMAAELFQAIATGRRG